MAGAFLATVLFSISAICGNRASKLLGGTEANFWRLLFAAALLAIYAHLFGGGLSGSAFRILFISGCIGFGIGDLSLFQALPRIGSRLSVMLVLCLSSPIGAALEWWWMKTALTAAQIASALGILLGVAVALAPARRNATAGSVDSRGNAGDEKIVAGTIFGVIAAICQALGAVLSRQAFALERNIDGITAAYQRILGGVLVTGIFLVVIKGNWSTNAKEGSTNGQPGRSGGRLRKALPLVFLNGLSGPALGVSCYQWALKTSPTGIVLPIVALTPVVIIPLSLIFEHERPSRRSIAGAIIAVLGAAALAMVRSAGK